MNPADIIIMGFAVAFNVVMGYGFVCLNRAWKRDRAVFRRFCEELGLLERARKWSFTGYQKGRELRAWANFRSLFDKEAAGYPILSLHLEKKLGEDEEVYLSPGTSKPLGGLFGYHNRKIHEPGSGGGFSLQAKSENLLDWLLTPEIERQIFELKEGAKWRFEWKQGQGSCQKKGRGKSRGELRDALWILTAITERMEEFYGVEPPGELCEDCGERMDYIREYRGWYCPDCDSYN